MRLHEPGLPCDEAAFQSRTTDDGSVDAAPQTGVLKVVVLQKPEAEPKQIAVKSAA